MSEGDFWVSCLTCYFLGIFWVHFMGVGEAVAVGVATAIFAIILYYTGGMKSGKK